MFLFVIPVHVQDYLTENKLNNLELMLVLFRLSCPNDGVI